MIRMIINYRIVINMNYNNNDNFSNNDWMKIMRDVSIFNYYLYLSTINNFCSISSNYNDSNE